MYAKVYYLNHAKTHVYFIQVIIDIYRKFSVKQFRSECCIVQIYNVCSYLLLYVY